MADVSNGEETPRQERFAPGEIFRVAPYSRMTDAERQKLEDWEKQNRPPRSPSAVALFAFFAFGSVVTLFANEAKGTIAGALCALIGWVWAQSEMRTYYSAMGHFVEDLLDLPRDSTKFYS